AQRLGFPDLVMNPAPGYDRLIPHDMMHLVVEAQLGITRGVFGQLAAGGTAGTFHLSTKRDESSREMVRAGNRVRMRGKKLLKEGRDDSVRSERATYICWYEWLARSHSSDRKKVSQAMAQQARQVRQTASTKELRALNESKLDEICKHLDHLSSHWSRLEVGESVAIRWPDLEIITAVPGSPPTANV
ncbi:MAG TPA: hypothetical protein VHS05_23630, partial [Pyrinomonadaceae bacterium]|nr:hypothetical protein [Pyrinomonadaceae bacterium]